MRDAPRDAQDRLKTVSGAAVITGRAITSEETLNDHGNARLSLSAGPPAGAAEAVRYADAEIVGQARHQAGRILHHADRYLQSGTDLFRRVGFARRARKEMDRISERSGLARRPRQERG